MAAKIVSVIFYPLLIPLYGLLVVFFAPTLFWYIPSKAKLLLFLIFLFDNFLVPMLLMPFFRYRNMVSSWMPGNIAERTIPLMTVSLWYAITSFILFRLQIPVFFKAYSYSLTMVSVALLAMNKWWNISAYGSAAGTVLAMILALSIDMSVSIPIYLAAASIIAAVILSARLKQNTHSPREIYIGFFTGLSITAVVMLLLQ
ncbi:MAG TPA: hypothetical protein VMT63_13190 [Bacteroidales bacterium]|nr:hypothetical protein [Bacteroidales bacterium]